MGTPCGFKSHLPQPNREQKCSRFFLRVSPKPRSGAGTRRHGGLLYTFRHAQTVIIWFKYKGKGRRICDSLYFVEPTGLEPMTSRTSSGRSSQLSYGSIFCSSSDKDSGTDGARTRDLSRVRRTLIPAELRFHDPVRFSLTSPSEYLCILLHCL